MIESAPAIQTRAEIKTSDQKETNLRRLMRELGRVLVAYSGGVDSTYLALIATQELNENALCVMGISPSVSAFQRAEGQSLASAFGFNFESIDTSEFDNPDYVGNPANRCYFCKSELYSRLGSIAADSAAGYVVIDGTNADDLTDVRPGRIAATENSVRSPLAELGFTKDDIRERSRVHGLPTWDRPASPCLSSRVAHGVPVTVERLSKVERGEAVLRAHGLREFRVRVHGELVRIEVAPDEFEKVLDRSVFEKFSREFKALGFRFVTLDLGGFRSGSMNEQS